jgi:glycine/D-amino acid oxidase-like deaminating enzyme
MDRVDALVIGAGAVGLAVARQLALAGRETIVTEAQSGIGQGVSSRNSEVIHAGLYYAPGSLKARLCVRGKELLYALCASHGVEHRRCGKLTVANDAGEVAALRKPGATRGLERGRGRVVGRRPGARDGARVALHRRPAFPQHRHRRQPRLHAGAAGRPRARRRDGRFRLRRRERRAGSEPAIRTSCAWPMAANSRPTSW